METSTQRDRVFHFGPFELSECEGELRKNGVRIKLQEQPFLSSCRIGGECRADRDARRSAAKAVALRHLC
jgi:hypothetical protein